MHAPVSEGDDHRLPRRVESSGLGLRWRAIVLDRFGDGEIHEADPHARRKEHCQPGNIGEIGVGIVRAEFQPPGGSGSQDDHHGEEAGNRCDIEPAETVDHPGLGMAENHV